MKPNIFRKKPLHFFLAICFGISNQSVQASENEKEPTFDKSLLWGESLKNLDFNQFQNSSTLPEGEYSIDVIINETPAGRRDIRLVKAAENGKATPCISRSLLLELGVRADRLPEAKKSSDDTCIDLAKTINGAFYEFDSNLLRRACPNFCVNGVWVTPVEGVPRTEW